MRRQIAGLTLDVAPPEKPKFKSPLILIHGLWSGSWCWQTWATHFSNLGWECWSINFRGRGKEEDSQILERLTFEDCLADLKKVVADSPSPPILLGHDLGALIAQKATEQAETAALVLLSPVPPKGLEPAVSRSLRLLRLKYGPLVFLGRPFYPREKDMRQIWLASVPLNQQSEILRSMVLDSPHLIKDFFKRRIEADPGRIRCPVLTLGGTEDQLVSMSSLRELARWLRGDFKEYSNHGHWIMGEEGGEGIVRDIHRWLLQRLGEDLLLAEVAGRGE